MHLQQFTVIENTSDPTRINRVRFLVADHPDPDARKEWLDVQVSVDLPTVLNGALLRSKVLSRARDILDVLATDYERRGTTIQK